MPLLVRPTASSRWNASPPSDALAEHMSTRRPVPGGLDVLAQHLMGVACSGPFDADALYDEVRRAAPSPLAGADFDDVLDFVATGGYALRTYDRYRRLGRARMACGGGRPRHAPSTA